MTNCPALAPGSELKVSGGANVGEVFERGVLVTAIVSTARRDRSFETAFEGIALNNRYGFRPEPPPHPVMAGTLPARVTSTTVNDAYGHIDRDGRYRVNMLFDRAGWETGFESLWVRQARPYAGTPTGCTCRYWRGPKWPSPLSTATQTGLTLPGCCTTRRTATTSPSATTSAMCFARLRTTSCALTIRRARSTSSSAPSTGARVS